MSNKIRYAVWGKDSSYRWLWLAALVAGWDAAKKRYRQGTTHDSNVTLQCGNDDFVQRVAKPSAGITC